MEPLPEVAVSLPAHVSSEALPTSSGNIFEFVFSNPFAPDAPSVLNAPKPLRSHHLVGKIPLSKPVFVDGTTGAQLSWGKLRSDALAVASTLINGPLALRPTPVSTSDMYINRGAIVSPLVLLHLPNCLQFCVLAYGVLASGLTFTGANPALTSGEIAHILIKSEPAVIVTTRSGLDNFQAAFASLSPDVQARLGYATRGNVFLVDPDSDDYGASAATLNQAASSVINGWKVQSWKVLLPAKPAPFTVPQYAAGEDDLRAAIIFWSSGTSGKSKGVILSHKALGSALIACWHGSGLKENERLIGLPPFYHIFGWANNLMIAPSFSATVTIVSKFDPQQYLRLAQETRATHLHIAPPVAVLFAKSPLLEGYDLSSVKACTSGGAPLGSSIIREVYNRLGCLVKMGYGLSETSGVTGQMAETWDELEKILGSTGVAFPGVELRIISVDTAKTVSVGEQGEVLIRAPYQLRSYLNNDEATAESLDDEGWFHTGDVGKLDIHGNLYIVDRLKEVIKVKGFQVSPAELEDGLCSSPLVQDAGVSSIYHEDHATEYPRAFVVPFDKNVLEGGAAAHEFAHELRKHIEGKHAPYKWLRGGVMIIEAVPKSPAGKILRRLLNDTKGHLVHVYEDKIRAKL